MAKKKKADIEMIEKINQAIGDNCLQKAFFTLYEDEELGKYLMLNFHLPEVDYDEDDNEVIFDMVTEEGMSWGAYIADALKEWMKKNPEYDLEWVKDQLRTNVIGMIESELFSKLD